MGGRRNGLLASVARNALGSFRNRCQKQHCYFCALKCFYEVRRKVFEIEKNQHPLRVCDDSDRQQGENTFHSLLFVFSSS